MRPIHAWLAAVSLVAALNLAGQTGRDVYRQAYAAWRQVHGSLERDAGVGGPAAISQADRAAAAAASFGATRSNHLKTVVDDVVRRRQILQTPVTAGDADLAPPKVSELIGSEVQIVNRTIASFANDRDRGIQQLRQSLERERDALTALTDSMQARQKAVEAAALTVAPAEQSRMRAAGAFSEQTAKLTQTVEDLQKETAAWAGYYESLTQAMQVANAPPPVSVTPPPVRSNPVSSVPLARYVGAWTYPVVNGIFHGAQPDFVDLVVHEQGGHVDGSLFGRFKLAPGAVGDPLVRFDFQGDLGPAANQKFALVTSDDARGTIELIPGPAFNLLEVNFQTDPKPNKIRVGNFILVKK